jgi:hypothetical protein
MELTTAVIQRVLRALGLPSGYESPFDLLDATRQGRHQVAMTLVSLWEQQGRFVSPALRYELRLHRDLQTSLREVRDEQRSHVPRSGFVKGLEIASLYPQGVLREMKDLDVLVPHRADVWVSAARLLKQGWSIRAFSLLELAGRGHVVVGLQRPAQDPQIMFPQVVEIATIAFPGTRPVAWSSFQERDDAPLKNLLAMLNERVEDRVWRTTPRARDLIDAIMLLQALGPAAQPKVWAAVQRHGFGREWAELTTFLARLRLLPEGFTADAGPVTVHRRLAALRRAAHNAAPVTGAVGWLQNGMVADRTSASRRRVARLLEQRVSPRRVLRTGLPLFGLRIDEHPAAEDLELIERDRAAVARTPIGTFALSFTDSVDRARRLAATLPAPTSAPA